MRVHIYGPAAAGAACETGSPGTSRRRTSRSFATLAARFSFHEVERAWRDRRRCACVRRPSRTRADGRLPHRGERPHLRLRPGPRAGAEEGPLGEQPDGTLSGSRSPAASTCSSTTRSTRPRSTRRGWGGGIELPDFTAFVQRADPARVLMFHHDPAHSDSDVEAMLAEAATLLDGSGPRVELAFEGMEIALD